MRKGAWHESSHMACQVSCVDERFAASRAVNGYDHVSYTMADSIRHNVYSLSIRTFRLIEQVGNYMSQSDCYENARFMGNVVIS